MNFHYYIKHITGTYYKGEDDWVIWPFEAKIFTSYRQAQRFCERLDYNCTVERCEK